MKRTLTALAITLIVFSAILQACTTAGHPSDATSQPTPFSSASDLPVRLPVLDRLLSDQAYTAALKSKVELNDGQIAALRKITSEESAKIRSAGPATQTTAEQDAGGRALKAIRELVGSDKTDQMLALALERGSDQLESLAAKEPELTMLKGPNAVPNDTRIVVNIPAFRMDVFKEGALLKSYKVGIGYQEFPLPTGFRKAEMIVFNPTWTQPNESWASNPGEVVPAGDKGNPLGPIKVPIGGANLIHGGKALAKIGTFASHGCVGLTNEQVKEFARILADATNTPLKDETIAAYLKKKIRTQVVKLSHIVPVELRYETIVIQDGQLHVYRDVYNKNTNTEQNLRAAFEANRVVFDSLSEEEKTRALEAVNAMSLRPKKQPTKPQVSVSENSTDKRALFAERKIEAERQRKLRNQKEIVVDLSMLTGKGYPSPRDLNTGATTTLTAPAKPKPPRRNPTPAPQSSPQAGPSPRNTAGPQ
jgi:lipoprotein-anchoring transpeptidase ErfK/SrfK